MMFSSNHLGKRTGMLVCSRICQELGIIGFAVLADYPSINLINANGSVHILHLASAAAAALGPLSRRQPASI